MLLAFAGGCGSKPHTSTPKAADAQDRPSERERLEAERPEPPYQLRATHAFESPGVCGQGPYRISTRALGSHYGEQIKVTACARVAFEADYLFFSNSERGEPRHVGWASTDDRCVARASELAKVEPTSDSSSGGAGKGAPKKNQVAAAAPAAATPQPLKRITYTRVACPPGMTSIPIHNLTITNSTDAPAVPSTTEMGIELWSAVPLHLEGAIFLIQQYGVPDNMTDAKWHDFAVREAAWWQRYRDFIERQVRDGKAQWVDDKPHTAQAPPPARSERQPPKPSPNAEWIAGYWHRDHEWVWIAGFWRVPEADVVAERTIEAPQAPPPVREEAKGAQPATTAVWTPGYWAWDGQIFVWVTGAWRIPPAQSAWVAPTWRARNGRVRFVPGGWRVRIGR